MDKVPWCCWLLLFGLQHAASGTCVWTEEISGRENKQMLVMYPPVKSLTTELRRRATTPHHAPPHVHATPTVPFQIRSPLLEPFQHPTFAQGASQMRLALVADRSRQQSPRHVATCSMHTSSPLLSHWAFWPRISIWS